MDAMSLLESGEFSDVSVNFGNEIYRLHKFPLLLKMGFVKDKFNKSSDIAIPFLDGGSEMFTDLIAFCYGKYPNLAPHNVAYFNNAAHFLDMFGKGNLIEITDAYINTIISEMKISHKFGPVIVALAFAATIKDFEICDVFIRLYDAVLSTWVSHSQHNDVRLAVDPVLTEFLVFLPVNVLVRLIQEVSSAKSTFPTLAELAAKFFAVRFSLDAKLREINGINELPSEDAKIVCDSDSSPATLNHLKRAVANACIPFERLSSLDRDMLVEELLETDFVTAPLVDVMDKIFAVLPSEIPLTSKVNVDWCKQVGHFSKLTKTFSQALMVTERKKDESTCRPLILEIAGKMLSRFTVPELRVIPPQTIKDILSTMQLPAVRSSSTTSEVTSDERRLDVASTTAQNKPDNSPTIADNLDQYFNAAIESQNMTIEEYIGLLKTALPLDCRDNHDGLIKAICKLVKTNKASLTDTLREEILGVIDLRRCSASGLQEALDANILPTRAVAEAALRFAKQNTCPVQNSCTTPISRDRCCSPSPARYASSTTSLYRTSRYMLPYQHYSSSFYHPIASSTNTGYLLTSPIRQRRRPWDRPMYAFDEGLPYYRHHDFGSDYMLGKQDSEDLQWNEDRHYGGINLYRSGEY
uniref:BTB domain-containing protein n=1 Tax=Mesocestoides corti TaxID=53468 RepID=A0A5K3F4K6_MESCO